MFLLFVCIPLDSRPETCCVGKFWKSRLCSGVYLSRRLQAEKHSHQEQLSVLNILQIILHLSLIVFTTALILISSIPSSDGSQNLRSLGLVSPIRPFDRPEGSLHLPCLRPPVFQDSDIIWPIKSCTWRCLTESAQSMWNVGNDSGTLPCEEAADCGHLLFTSSREAADLIEKHGVALNTSPPQLHLRHTKRLLPAGVYCTCGWRLIWSSNNTLLLSSNLWSAQMLSVINIDSVPTGNHSIVLASWEVMYA